MQLQADSRVRVYHEERDVGIVVAVPLERVRGSAVIQVGRVEDTHYVPVLSPSAAIFRFGVRVTLLSRGTK